MRGMIAQGRAPGARWRADDDGPRAISHPAPGSTRARKRARPRHRLGPRQDRGSRAQGPRRRARAATRPPGYEGGQMPLQRRLPKRGFRNPSRARAYAVVNLGQPRRASPPARWSTPRRCVARGLVREPRRRSRSSARATLDARAHRARRTPSAQARAKSRIAAAGGSAEVARVLEGFSNASRIPELRRRGSLFTAAMLAVYRVGVAIPTPGHRRPGAGGVLRAGARTTMLGLVNLFSGGALERFSIFALGIMPYISASIILQLLTVVVPVPREALEGGRGRAAQDHPVHALRHGRPVARPELRSSACGLETDPGARAAAASSSTRAGASALMTDDHAHRRAPRSSCGSASRSPSAASATASR